ncbi:uncharacterized protein LOC141588003 [Silene latifolia]|uniref:uncharacterized protein LOC141588003 n=1 Tax=Silene latifolia TaxID=37657 RepID=UPI003D78329E
MKVRYQGPWGVCGDFNCVLNFNERIGRDVTWADIANFRDCVDFCGLMDMKGQGAFFTWNNKQAPSTRGYSRIDRFLVNDDWMDIYPGAYAHFLPEGLFDHNPCVCYRRNSGVPRKRQFKYYNMWSLDPGFKSVVQQSWNVPIAGTPMYQVVIKLKNMKGPLKELNRNGFSDVDKSVVVARALLEEIHIKLHSNHTDSDLINAECAAAESYRHLCKIQHSFLSQKAKIEAAFLHYYKSLLGSSLPTTTVHIPTVRQGKLVTEEQCSIFLAEVTDIEIKDFLFSISSIKSPGPDGFSSQFFKDTWEIVGGDITAAIKIFFQTGKLHNPTYSLNINGNKFGFFKGKRGLRQGDPLSPLLFTICMEYLSRILGVVATQDGFRFHPLCGHLRLNHLLFADDLLLFCKGTAPSIMWILRAFATFSSASGLCLNRTKSEIYFNGVNSGTVDDILQVSGFLGVVSHSSRLTLLNSVLATLHSYWASIFLIPNGIMNRITNLCRNFLWKGSSDYKGAPNVNWESCCLPKEERGLGIKDIKTWNKALLGKYVWWHANKKDHLWVRWRLQVALNVHFRMPDLITRFSVTRRITKHPKRYIGSCYVALVYWIWRCRNEAWINNRVRSPGPVVKQILADVRVSFLALNVTALKDKDRVWFDTL